MLCLVCPVSKDSDVPVLWDFLMIWPTSGPPCLDTSPPVIEEWS